MRVRMYWGLYGVQLGNSSQVQYCVWHYRLYFLEYWPVYLLLYCSVYSHTEMQPPTFYVGRHTNNRRSDFIDPFEMKSKFDRWPHSSCRSFSCLILILLSLY